MCDISDEQSATHVRYSPRRSPEEMRNILSLHLELALLGRLVWSRCPLVKNELTDIDCDSHERRRDSSLAGDMDSGNDHVGGLYSQRESDFGVKVSETDTVEVASAEGRPTP